MKFWNGSKTLIDDLADFSRTWTGYNAKYFEERDQSNNADVTLYSNEFVEGVTSEPLLGTVNAKSVKYCYGPSGTATSSLLSGASVEDEAFSQFYKLAFKTFFSWAVENYPESFA